MQTSIHYSPDSRTLPPSTAREQCGCLILNVETVGHCCHDQYVFVERCGCADGSVDGAYARTEQDAWDLISLTRQHGPAMRARGVTVVVVSHDEYMSRYYPLTPGPCPHQRTAAE
jgi:hypothetical protein